MSADETAVRKRDPIHEVIHPDCLTQQVANPTSRTRGATNEYYQVEQERIEVILNPKKA